MSTRKLINESHILEAVKSGNKSLSIPKGSIITPLARDAARKHGVTLTADVTPSSRTKSATSASRILCIGSDHGGYALKGELTDFLKDQDWKVIDVGTDSSRSCDYPDFAYAVASMVADGRAKLGIMIDGAGIGSSIVCNKVPGIRAACAYNEFTAWNARAHNDANVLTLGSRTLGVEVVKRITSTFLATSYEGGRHELRVAKMTDIETKFSK